MPTVDRSRKDWAEVDQMYQEMFARYAPGVDFTTLSHPIKQILRDHADFLYELLPQAKQVAEDMEDLRNTWSALAFSSQIHSESTPHLLLKAQALLLRLGDLKWKAEMMVYSARTQVMQVLPAGNVTERKSDAELYVSPLRAVESMIRHFYYDLRAVLPTLRDWTRTTMYQPYYEPREQQEEQGEHSSEDLPF